MATCSACWESSFVDWYQDWLLHSIWMGFVKTTNRRFSCVYIYIGILGFQSLFSFERSGSMSLWDEQYSQASDLQVSAEPGIYIHPGECQMCCSGCTQARRRCYAAICTSPVFPTSTQLLPVGQKNPTMCCWYHIWWFNSEDDCYVGWAPW